MSASEPGSVPPVPEAAAPPPVLVVMGVSGSGKSTVAALVAARLGWPFVDGDDFHASGSVAKMHAGLPLDDDDRTPWLARIGEWIGERLARGEPGVVVCSALRRRYRAVLAGDRPGVRIVYLEGSRALIAERLARRVGHFMSPRLLDSQFDALEPPGPDERPITVDIAQAPEAVAGCIVAALGPAARAGAR